MAAAGKRRSDQASGKPDGISASAAKIDRVASNRAYPRARRQPVGTCALELHRRPRKRGRAGSRLIDPFVQPTGFWDGDKPLALLTYYATHPQSWPRQGRTATRSAWRGWRRGRTARRRAHPLRRCRATSRQQEVHDADAAKVDELAGRVADGLPVHPVERRKISAKDAAWTYEPVVLPVSPRWMAT